MRANTNMLRRTPIVLDLAMDSTRVRSIFAANEMKLMLSHLLKFDWKFKDGKMPVLEYVADQAILNHGTELLYKSRTPEVWIE